MRLRHLLAIVTVVMVGAAERVVLAQTSNFFVAPLESTSTVPSGAGGATAGAMKAGDPVPGGATAVAAGTYHSCLLTDTGGVKCWGDNDYGELGDGTYTDRSSPVDVTGLASGVTALAPGREFTCALTSGGAVMCWGHNRYGNLGDGTIGTYSSRSTPGIVAGLASGSEAVVAGDRHTCAVTSGGGVKCWGSNSYGQLGDGTTTERTTPVDVSGLASGAVALAVGRTGFHTCALTGSGGVKCWGSNSNGQLGDGTTTDRLTPVDVSGLASGVVALAAGNSHTCALTSGGGVKCWGSNGYGQLGDGTATQRLTPVDVTGLTSGAVGIADSASNHTCALTSGGGVKCWGLNSSGQLGDGTTTQRSTPVAVVGLAGAVIGVTDGGTHACAVSTDGGVQCWGSNAFGQLGDGATAIRLVPGDVSGLPGGISTVTAGGTHT